MKAKEKYLIVGGLVILFIMLSKKGSATSAGPGEITEGDMSIMDKLLYEIKNFEGIQLTAYPDAGKYSIGYGSQFNFTKNRPVQKGDVITLAEANDFLRKEALTRIDDIDYEVKINLTNNQRIALGSFVYNVGITAFQDSTMLQMINNGTDLNIVANQFDRWIYSQKKIIPNLVKRRKAEKKLFLS